MSSPAMEEDPCAQALYAQHDRVCHFARRALHQQLAPRDMVILLAGVDCPVGGPLAVLCTPPEHLPAAAVSYAEMRARGERPYRRGLAAREFVQNYLDRLGPSVAPTAQLLRAETELPVVVVDYNAVLVASIEVDTIEELPHGNDN